MAGTLIRAVAENNGKSVGVRTIHRLSDGSLVAVIADGNRNDITGDGGDNTNVGKIYVYTAPDPGTTWTLRATVTTDIVGTTDFFHYSSAIDASNNVHITYVSHALNAVYVLVTFAAGPAYTVGTPVTVFTNSTNEKAYGVDVDTMGATGTVAVVGVVTTNASTNINTTHAYVGSVVTFTQNGTSVQLSTGAHQVTTPAVTVCACKDTIVSNVGTYLVMSCLGFTDSFSTLKPLNQLNSVQCNVSTGVVATNTLLASNLGSNNGAQYPFWLTNTNGSRTFYLQNAQSRQGGIETGHNAQWMWIFTLNTAGTVATDTVPLTSQTVYVPYFAPVWTGNAIVGLLPTGSAGSFSELNAVFVFPGSSIVQQSGANNFWNNDFLGPTWICYTGNNRNYSSLHVDVMSVSDTATTGIGCGVYYDRLHVPLAPSSIVPASGASVTTDRPALTANYENDFDNVQLAEKMVWQLATDAGFTLNVKTVTDLDTAFSSPHNTGPTNATVTETNAIGATTELFQTTWYIRSATIDTLGNQGAWSTAHTFVVTHPPTATNLSPNGGQVIVYGTGNITFAWTFSDPSPFDFQTAYEILVTKVSDGTTVVDSGIITSASQSGVVNISSSDKNIPLQWQVRVYDSDSVTNGYTAPQTFSLADAPAPTFTSPTNGGTITSGVPVITWTPGLAGSATETSWRFTITQAGVVVYDTGIMTGSATSFSMPPGFLHTAQLYTFTLIVTDSNSISGTTAITVTSAWTPPAAADLKVYTYEFNRKGFVFLGWTAANIDASHFSVWNVYRKKTTDSTWTLLDTISNFTDSYGYRDYGAAALTTYQYVVTQIVIASTGDIVESAFTTFVTTTTPSGNYWLLDPLGFADAVAIYGVNADTFTDEYEIADFIIIGRGRHVDIGSHLGANGTLTAAMRDKQLGIPSEINYLLNPGFQSHIIGVTPDNWTLSAAGTHGTLVTDYYNFYEPAPNGALTNLAIRVSSLATGGGNYIMLSQNVPLARLPFTIAGQTFSLSFWEALEPDLTDVQLNTYAIGVQYFNASNTLLSTDEVAVTASDHYEPTGNPDASSGNWFRLARTLTVPAGAIDHITVYLKVFTTSGTVYPELFQGGAQLESGSVSQYFDGDMPGASWINGQYVSTSQGGLYTARQQRLDIATMAALDRPVYLRNPFGDIIYCSLQTDTTPSGSALTREAGYGGGVDYGQLTIPYLQVGF